MKRKKVLYLIYVNGDKLMENCILKKMYEQKYGNDFRYVLFGVTTDPEKLEAFFIIHKKEYFMIKEEKVKITKDMESDLEKKFYDYWLTYSVLSVGIWIDDRLQYKELALALSHEEDACIGYELEVVDEFLYDFWSVLDLHKAVLKSKYIKRPVMKALRALGMKKAQYLVESLYGEQMERNLPFTSTFHMNEWRALCNTYGELIIGGDREDSYI